MFRFCTVHILLFFYVAITFCFYFELSLKHFYRMQHIICTVRRLAYLNVPVYAKRTHELNQAFVPNLLALINLFTKRNLFAHAYFSIFWSFSCTFVSCHFECNLRILVDQDWDWFSHRLNSFIVYLQYNYSWRCYILSRVATLSGMLGCCELTGIWEILPKNQENVRITDQFSVMPGKGQIFYMMR